MPPTDAKCYFEITTSITFNHLYPKNDKGQPSPKRGKKYLIPDNMLDNMYAYNICTTSQKSVNFLYMQEESAGNDSLKQVNTLKNDKV